MGVYLVLSVQSTPFLNENCDDVTVSHHSGTVQGCLVTLGRKITQNTAGLGKIMLKYSPELFA